MHRHRPWPRSLLLARHGESEGNLARRRAEESGAPMIDIEVRDMDVALSPHGVAQATALGRHLAALPRRSRPNVVLASPYVRARDTARLAVEAAGLDVDVVADERLREREFGVLDRLTTEGIRSRHPDQAAFRSFLGKFYHRPPGGESWADVALRVRSVLSELSTQHDGARVLVVSHEVVVLVFRYVVERMTEADVLAVDRAGQLANCSLTSYRSRRGCPELVAYNDTSFLRDEGAPVTTQPDVVAAAG